VTQPARCGSHTIFCLALTETFGPAELGRTRLLSEHDIVASVFWQVTTESANREIVVGNVRAMSAAVAACATLLIPALPHLSCVRSLLTSRFLASSAGVVITTNVTSYPLFFILVNRPSEGIEVSRHTLNLFANAWSTIRSVSR